MSNDQTHRWPFLFPSRRRPGRRPHLLQTLLAVAVFNDQMPDFSYVQGVNLPGGSAGQSLTGSIPGLSVTGITPGGSTSAPFYLQGTWELLNGGTVLQPTAATAGPSGAFTPMYWLNTITYYGGNLYVIGSTGSEFGVLRFDAATGNPNGSGSSPLYLALDSLVENSGMSLVTFQGQAALAIPLASGIAACLISGSGTPSLVGPIPYSSFPVSVPSGYLAMTAPWQGPTNLYFLYFDGFNPSGGAGLGSVTIAAIEAAILSGSTANIKVNQITPLGSLPVTCAWCVNQINNQDVVYVATTSWVNQTTPIWSIEWINASNGVTTPLNLNLPGVPWGMCVVTVML